MTSNGLKCVKWCSFVSFIFSSEFMQLRETVYFKIGAYFQCYLETMADRVGNNVD